MSYRNPKAAPINTGAAVYQGIQKLAGDVYTFANEERIRKGELIAESLAAQQAIDDDVNKMGLNVGEGTNNFETQIFEEAQAAKQKIAAQYDIMSRTFSSPKQRAEAKAEINRLNKYPESLVADLTTGKYLVDQFNKGLTVTPGKAGSISATNNLDLLEVVKDMKGGGKNTKMETNAAGARTLVTTVGDKTYKLNISNITNGLKTNPNQMIFNTVADDSGTTDTYLSAIGLAGKTLDLPALVNSNILKKESIPSTVVGEKANEIYTINRGEVEKAVSNLSTSLIDDPSSYTYANSIWQDKINGEGTLKQALGERDKDGSYKNRDAVLKQIRNHYVDAAIKKAKLDHGISVQLPKAEKADKYESDKDLVTLSRNIGKVIPIEGINYKIVGDSKNKGSLYIQAERKAKVSKNGTIDIPSLDYDIDNQIPLYNYNEKTKKYSLNYGAFRTLTGSTGRKQ